jgi:endoglucanase
MYKMQIVTFVLIIMAIFGCKKEDVNTLTVNKTSIQIPLEGGASSISIETDADAWAISNPGASWITLSATGGNQKTALVSISVSGKTIAARTDTLVITAGNAAPVKVVVSQPASDYLYTMSADLTSLSFFRAGNTLTLKVTTDAPEWAISSDVNWLTFDPASGTKGTISVKVTAHQNLNVDDRTAQILVSAQYAPEVKVTAKQKGEYYPSYNTAPLAPDMTGMTSTAAEIAARIKLGWNIGNTLEAIGGETAWGNPRVTETLIKLVKDNGFTAIRIPCSWNQYMANSKTAQIKADWLDRVKTVVKYCVDNDMYVVLNIHWDGGWLENNCTKAKQEENNAKQKAFWEQIATHLRDFDEHLIFASANEPNVEDATQMAVLNSYHQTFIDAVRSTGGKNSYRVLAIQGPATDIEKTNTLVKTLPTDKVPNKMMFEVHYYTPYTFCLMSEDATWGKMAFYWGNGYHSTTDPSRNATFGEEATVDALFASMKTKFVDKGIPVILGEYAAVRRTTLTGDDLTLHLNSRAYYINYVTKKALENGILPFYWDAGGMGNLGSAIFNRQNNTVFDQQILDAMNQAANQ